MKTVIKQSSTGGVIRILPNRTIHLSKDGAYSGRHAEDGTEPKTFDAPKRGRGRPRKDKVYDFSKIFPAVKIPKWKGETRTIRKLGDE